MKVQNCLTYALLQLLTVSALAISTQTAATDAPYSQYIFSPQIEHPLRPLSNIPSNAIAKAAVITVADPIETHLGRAFDIQISSLIKAFQLNDYVLDRYAFPWKPAKESRDSESSRPPYEGTSSFQNTHRRTPGILVFRKDLWRKANATQNEHYFVVFLVGESPTFGVHPRAFQAALKCAISVNLFTDLNLSSTKLLTCDTRLVNDASISIDIIGPSFSGSLSSIIVQLQQLVLSEPTRLTSIQIISPSATVESNRNVKRYFRSFIERVTKETPKTEIEFWQLARSIPEQLLDLCAYDKTIRNSRTSWFSEQTPDLAGARIVIFAEESTFGQGVKDLAQKRSSSPPLESHKHLDDQCNEQEWQDFVARITVINFPPNVAAIRAEHHRINQRATERLDNVLPLKNALLELDLSGIERNIDRPPAYHRHLSSRSGELRLLGLFDALNRWVKPKLVIIVATDVRDRLFLLNELRKHLPYAVPVMLETDYLLAHPNYRKITRGSLILPVSESLVCISNSKLPATRTIKPCYDYSHPKSYLPFPSGHAANIFRAIYALLEQCEIEHELFRGEPSCQPDSPELMVATLAGFQAAQSNDQGRAARQILLATGARGTASRFVFTGLVATGLFFLAAIFWLKSFGVLHLVMLSPFRYSDPFHGIKEKEFTVNGEKQVDVAFEAVPILAGLLIAIASIGVLALAGSRLIEVLVFNQTSDALVHGRDLTVLVCLFLINLCIVAIAFWRIYRWRSLISCACIED